MLLHCPMMRTIFHQIRVTPYNDNHSPADELQFPGNEQQDANKFISERRLALSVRPDQQFMMAFAWVTPLEKLRFKMFPMVIYCDATMDTNNEGRPLLTMTGKDTSSKTFTILRVYLPNQQMWVFRWVFNVLLPEMYGNQVLSNVNTIITDGDSQEISQLDNAITTFFPHVKRIRCGWHIINRGWMKHIEGPKSFHKKFLPVYRQIKETCHTWLYSWMQSSYCETKKEYSISKALFLKYITMPNNVSKIGTMLVTNILSWFKRFVETHEDQYCYYLRKHLLCFGEYSNSATEGCNNGMK